MAAATIGTSVERVGHQSYATPYDTEEQLAPPNPKDPWPPIPSVLREHDGISDLCNLQWTLRRSHVALLLSGICSGMDSGASLEDVLARVRDCDALGDLLACAEVDEEGREYGAVGMRNLLMDGFGGYGEEPLLLCWEGGDRDFQYMTTQHMKKQLKHALDPLKRRVKAVEHDAGCLSKLAKTAVEECDLVSFKWIVKKAMGNVPDEHLGLWGAMQAIGDMGFSGDDGYAARDRWMTPVYHCVNGVPDAFNRTYGGHDRATFERIVWWLIHEVHEESGCIDDVMTVLCAYLEWAIPALCKMWRKEEYLLRKRGVLAPGDDLSEAADADDDHLNPEMQWRESMRRLMRTSLVAMYDERVRPSTGKWKHVGWLMEAMADCCHANDPFRAIASFVREDRWFSKVVEPHGQLCMRALRLGWMLWRLQLHRERHRCLVEWLDAAGVYAPTERVDKFTAKAPKRLCAEWGGIM